MIGITRRLASNFPKNVRRMSGGANVQEEIKEMNKWKVSYTLQSCIMPCKESRGRP